ncbi:MAG: hypothetical protein EP343_28755 [Deltaproteobacteria bacterium]|nr:MAG: hypothetical protein EP343_28755 [Deltaproteobacteria bacterium]
MGEKKEKSRDTLSDPAFTHHQEHSTNLPQNTNQTHGFIRFQSQQAHTSADLLNRANKATIS